jgi:hypothetical protein
MGAVPGPSPRGWPCVRSGAALAGPLQCRRPAAPCWRASSARLTAPRHEWCEAGEGQWRTPLPPHLALPVGQNLGERPRAQRQIVDRAVNRVTGRLGAAQPVRGARRRARPGREAARVRLDARDAGDRGDAFGLGLRVVCVSRISCAAYARASARTRARAVDGVHGRVHSAL